MNAVTHARIAELDFIKAVMIVLMVAFHLVWFADAHPYAKQAVYTFHMPIFLLLSGYLSRADRRPREQFERLLWLFIPYAVMEVGYVAACSVLPVREHVASLSPIVMVYHVFVHPLGPYWYLHTLLLCTAVYYAVFHLNIGRSLVGNLILAALVMAVLRSVVVPANAMYFLFGVALHESRSDARGRLKLSDVCPPTWLALPALVWLLCYGQHLDRASLAGVAITYLVICLCFCVVPYVKGKVRDVLLFVGRNTLPVLLFSPIFTLLSKGLVGLFRWDASRLSFAVTAVGLSVAGSLFVAWLMDRVGLSRYFFGRRRVLK